MAIDINEYRACEKANRRMMDTTIWQACRILGIDPDGARPSIVFHELFERFYAEEMAKLEGGAR